MPNFDAARIRRPLLGGGLALVIVGVVGISAYAWSNLVRERRHTADLTASNQALATSLRQTQAEMVSLAEKLNALTAPPAAAPARTHATHAQPSVRTATRRSTVRASLPDDRWRQMQARLADQQKEIASTRQDVDQTRQDLSTKLTSTRDELNGSIAKNHDDLEGLKKRGERNYYEFQLDKSKQFQRVGPLSISVRKVNLKHKYYDLLVMADDRQLEKKHVDLYEPLMLTLGEHPQPIELVVNEIDVNHVKGYVSEPKYKESNLAAAQPAGAEGLERR